MTSVFEQTNETQRIPVAHPSQLAPSAPRSSTEWLSYRRHGETSNGTVIEEIIAQTAECGVFLTKKNGIHWEYNPAACVDATDSIGVAVELMTEARSSFFRGSVKRRALALVAIGLAKALQERREGDGRDFFAGARLFIVARHRELLHLSYVVWAAVMTAIIAAVGITLAVRVPATRDFAVAAALGSIGALVSVMQRFRSIQIDRYSSSAPTAMAGMSRALLGAIFGGLLILLNRADLVLSVASNRPFLLPAAAFIAGLCERLIPDLLERNAALE
ncbi:MAG: hypothetical protein ACXV5L_04950 [Thermoanaerobaculia bacterium]